MGFEVSYVMLDDNRQNTTYLTLKVARPRLSQQRQTETAFLNILPTFVRAYFNLPTSTSKHIPGLCVCVLLSAWECACVTFAHGCGPLSVSVYARSPKPNKLPSRDDYRPVSDVTHTPRGLRSCGPSHHCGVWSACLTVIVPNIRSRFQDSYYAAFNMTCHHTL